MKLASVSVDDNDVATVDSSPDRVIPVNAELNNGNGTTYQVMISAVEYSKWLDPAV